MSVKPVAIQTDLQNDKNSLRVGLAKQKGIITSAYLKLKANSDINPKFLYRLLHSYDTTKVFYGMGGGLRQSMKFEDFRRLPLLLPPYEEQVKISVFLDHETAKIDNLIEKQQQLIELLKEKRQAVISHAVTKGLNPDVPMKDSGVEWLGEVPEHWIIAQLKFNTLEMQTGPFGSQLHAEDYVIDGIPLINPAHMNAGMIIPDPKVTVDEATQERLGRHKLSEGEIIFSRRGELGRCAVVKKNNEGWLCGTGSLKAKLTKKIIPDYAYTLISSEGVVSELTLESKGSTMANLNTETFGRIRLPVPPISEQEAILDYIKIISDKYDYLIRSADTAIRLMQERRTALISAAVTGKIDVRDWDAPDTQDIEESQEAIA
ncbi:TPA: restriction endonuclease subunit S [Enterobacter hormaechei subsp. steigerwaltii]|uniref:restriction endonuclease subunit S n=1 Tax=Enterobacter hormaechei TaxID=158836 RepID=UPI0009409205|nr:restriction endonuclease subunit S [Enterobacter hormaechei]HED1554525.1 restriction endonuclease subunit S [Enterobacter hormaechei subsp. steigerwaltii]